MMVTEGKTVNLRLMQAIGDNVNNNNNNNNNIYLTAVGLSPGGSGIAGSTHFACLAAYPMSGRLWITIQIYLL
jgi:hypothetical protein